MNSKNSDFGVGGNVKLFYKSEFYTHDYKIHQSEPENYPLTFCIYTKLIYVTVLRYDQICVEKLQLGQILKNKPKSEISASKYQKYTKFTSRYMFLWMMYAMQLVQISLRITKDVKIQDGRQLWLKIRQAARYPNYEI